MASVGSLTSSTSNSIRGYGGLASGLDRDELIKGMTIGTTSKLNQQEQKKQKIEWMQEAVRTISDKMISFHGKYTETLTSSSNLFSSMLWGRNKITTTGDNSKYVSVSGSASTANAMTIMGVLQKAQNAALSSTSAVSTGELTGGAFNTTDTYNAAVEGSELHLKVGEGLYTVKLQAEEGKNLDSAKEIADAVNKALANEEYKKDAGKETPRHLSNFLEASVDANGKFVLKAKGGAANALELDAEKDDSGNVPEASKEIKLLEGSAMSYLGVEAGDLTGNGVSGNVDVKLSFDQKVLGKTLTFSYNGKNVDIKLPTAEDVEKAKNETPSRDKDTVIKDAIQSQMDAAFGKGRVVVEFNDESDKSKGLKFTTMVPGTEDKDQSAIFKLVGGDSQAMDALNLKAGASTRKDLSTTITDKLTEKIGDNGQQVTVDGKKIYQFKINDATFDVKEGATIQDLMNAINDKNNGLGLQVTYQESSDKFTFTSTENGASGAVKIDDAYASAMKDIFGIDMAEAVKAGSVKEIKDNAGKVTGYEKRGDDAIVSVKYAGSDEVVNLRRDSNTFTVDGLTISLKGKFGEYNADGTLKDVDDLTKAVEIDASVDVDRVMSTIKSFVEDYNSIVDLVNGELTTKHDRDYDPLTSDQKEELSESEITKWETKAKEGLLYGDSDLRSLSMDLRVVVSGGNLMKLQDIGISISSTYSDNGKLSIDETKLRAALETNPESVEKLFTNPESRDEYGNDVTGLATNLKKVMEKYVKTTGPMEEKGILIRKAGSKSAAMSLTQNTYYDQLTSIDKLIATLQARLKTEQDRYISQFSTLETMIANMNSQASYLSSM